MTNKYIVKNCPNYDEYSVEWDCLNSDVESLLCEDCTDCLIKQVVQELKDNGVYEYQDFANSILALFTIEEVE